MEEVLERQLLIRGHAFLTFSTTEKLSRAARKAGRMLRKPAQSQ